jgi:hypothetical protein
MVTAQPVPLPNSYPGFRWGNLNAPVLIEGFLDLLCPDCSGTWPTVKEVLNHYGPTNVSFIFHVFPLPYHTWAFHAAQGAQVVRSLNASDAGFFAYADLIFNNQGNFYSTTMTATQIIDAYATLVSANLPYSKSDFVAGMNDPNLNEIIKTVQQDEYDFIHLFYDVFHPIMDEIKRLCPKSITAISSAYPYVDQFQFHQRDGYDKTYKWLIEQKNHYNFCLSDKDFETFKRDGAEQSKLLRLGLGAQHKNFKFNVECF